MRPALLLVLAVAASCGRPAREPSPPRAEPPPLLGVLDVMDFVPEATPGPLVVHRQDAVVGGQTRRALCQVLRIPAKATRMARPPGWTIPIPSWIASYEQILANRVLVSRDKVTRVPLPAVTVTGPVTTPTILLPPTGFDALAELLDVTLSWAGDAAACDVETRPLPVPADAVLEFGMALDVGGEDAATSFDMRIAAVDDDGDTELWRGQLGFEPEGRRQWHEARADLRPVAGRTVRLRFTARPADGRPRATPLPLWGEPTILTPGGPEPFNVVLISLDTLRARSVSAYGSERPTSPRFDAFAAEGVLFEDATTTSPHTLPAHMSMFTGLTARSHGVFGWISALPSHRRTLPEALRQAGYATAAFTENAFVVPTCGFRRGFAAYAESKSLDLHRPDGRAAQVFKSGAAWLRARRQRPFFLFLHTYQVHFPYAPPLPYRFAFAAPDASWSPLEIERLQYDQEVRYTDDELGAFLDELGALGLSDRTLVIVTSDHGEAFGEHGHTRHGYALHDEVMRVPLAMRLPGAIPAGLTVREPASLADVVPTVLDLLGLPALPDVDGTSLAPLLAGASQLPRGGVFADAPSAYDSGWLDLSSVRTRTHTCMLFGRTGATECYRRDLDPFETAALPADAPGTEDPLRLVADHAGGAIGGGAAPARDGAALVAPPPAPVVIDPEREEKLRQLGYID